MTLQEEIKAIQDEAVKKQAEAENLQKLLALVPNLQRYVGRWGKVVYYSVDVNERVCHIDMRHNCGCCPDSPLEVWPYLITEHGKVYSDPPCFHVGDRCEYGGDTPYPEWEERLRSVKIPEIIIERIQSHFEKSKEEAIEALESAYQVSKS